MIVEEVMTKDVKTIRPGESVLKAAKKMTEFHIGCLVVSTKDKLEGIITDSDILERVVAEDMKASGVKVREVMTKDPVMIEHDKDISEAAELMSNKGIKKLPVVSGKTLVGILTAVDLAKVHPELIKQISSLMIFPKKGKSVAG